MKRSEIKNSSDLLYYKAQVDFNAAKSLLHTFEKGKIEIDLEVILFHLQQATEKLLKAILDKNNLKVPRIHDIEELIKLCFDNKIVLIENIDILVDMADFAVDGRYDLICDDINDTELYIKTINKLLNLTKEIIK